MTDAIRTLPKKLVTVIIPVGPDHAAYLPQAVNSVSLQTIASHETIVVDDTGSILVPESDDYQLIRAAGRRGAGYSRNQALEKVSTPFVVFLDADDLLTNTALESMLRRYALGDVSYVYGDWYDWNSDGTLKYMRATNEHRGEWLRRCCHIVTTLVPTQLARSIEGFDPDLRGWEDWEFYLRLNVAGYCGGRSPSPVMAYRLASGQRRQTAFQINAELLTQISATYGAYQRGEKEMAACRGCGEDGGAQQAAQAFAATLGTPVPSGRVRMEFMDVNKGTKQYRVNGREYSGADTPFDKFVDALPEDVQGLLACGVWRVAPMPATAPQLPPLVAPFMPGGVNGRFEMIGAPTMKDYARDEITNAPPKRVGKPEETQVPEAPKAKRGRKSKPQAEAASAG